MNIDEKMMKNRLDFELALKDVSLLDGDRKFDRFQEIATSAVLHRIGQFSSALLEEQLVAIAKSYHSKLPNMKKNSGFLHVLTKASLVGGHTRVVEQWIDYSPKDQRHSVLLLDQRDSDEIPELLKSLVRQREGDFLDISMIRKRIDRALVLRKIASLYECVILHIHMDDIVPTLAFGTEDFKTPVLYFNHADHDFWVGVSIADMVVSQRKAGKEICKKYRHTRRNEIIPLPIKRGDLLFRLDEYNRTKKELGIPCDSKILLTMASPYKYIQLEHYDFIKTAVALLQQTTNTYFIVIGPDSQEEGWKEGIHKSNGKLLVLGRKSHHEIEKYVQITDLMIDSFPVSSFTSVFDAAKYGVMALSLKTPVNALEAFEEAGIYCRTQDELVQRSIEFLQGEHPAENLLTKIIQRDHYSTGFCERLNSLLKNMPHDHGVHHFRDDPKKQITDFERHVFSTPYRSE